MMKVKRRGRNDRMRRSVTIGALVLGLSASGPARGGDHGSMESPQDWLQKRHPVGDWHPVGGWHPYGGGLFHWWNPQCFPRCGNPDDYCRKPLPRTCWPPYPPYYR